MSIDLTPFTPPEPHCLPVLLKLRDQCVAMLDHVGILLVLVIWPVGLDDTVDSVDRACDPVAGDELGQIPGAVSTTQHC